MHASNHRATSEHAERLSRAILPQARMLATLRSATVKLSPAKYSRPVNLSLSTPSGFRSNNSLRSTCEGSRANSGNVARCSRRPRSSCSISKTAQKLHWAGQAELFRPGEMERSVVSLREVDVHGHGLPQRHIAIHEGRNPRIRVESSVFGSLQIVGAGAFLYQLIGLARLFEHPQTPRRSRSKIAIQLNHLSPPRRAARSDRAPPGGARSARLL
jgi:hypothetical protein